MTINTGHVGGRSGLHEALAEQDVTNSDDGPTTGPDFVGDAPEPTDVLTKEHEWKPWELSNGDIFTDQDGESWRIEENWLGVRAYVNTVTRSLNKEPASRIHIVAVEYAPEPYEFTADDQRELDDMVAAGGGYDETRDHEGELIETVDLRAVVAVLRVQWNLQMSKYECGLLVDPEQIERLGMQIASTIGVIQKGT